MDNNDKNKENDILDENENDIKDDVDNNKNDDIVLDLSNQDIESLKKQVQELRRENSGLKRDVERAKAEADRERGKGQKILEEKRQKVDQLRIYQEMHDGIDEDVAKEVLRRAKTGESMSDEFERSKVVESAINEFKEIHHAPLLEEIQEKEQVIEKLRGKLHNAVIHTEIKEKLVDYGVIPSLSSLLVKEFENDLYIDEDGNRAYRNKDGYRTENFDWKGRILVLKQKMPEAFHKNLGTSAQPSTNGKGKSLSENPWLPETRNTGQQLYLMKNQPEEAKRLKAEAEKAKKSKSKRRAA